MTLLFCFWILILSLSDAPIYTDLTIIKRPCSVSECRNTCPGSSCLSPGTTVTVEVRCWSSEDGSAGNETTTFNITSVLGSPLSSEYTNSTALGQYKLLSARFSSPPFPTFYRFSPPIFYCLSFVSVTKIFCYCDLFC